MKVGSVFLILYVVGVTVAGLFLVEFIARKVNLENGIDIPGAGSQTLLSKRENQFLVIDPHLGYGRGKAERKIRKLEVNYSWTEGFAVYSKKVPAELDHPIILTLGGSTTDAVQSNHSWPEELSKLLAERGISATVVNGGTGGYSTNQELLKLVRDGLEFKPDIVISYSGVNDRGKYSELPYPMVHPYQRYMLEFLTRPKYSPLFPNATYLLSKMLGVGGKPRAQVDATFGVPTSRTLGQQYERNMVLMEAIARASGATFYGIIQPNAYVRPGGEIKNKRTQKYVSDLLDLYRQIADVPVRLLFVHNFISIFDGEGEGAFKDDGIHTTLKGDKIIAEKVLDLIYPDLHRSARRQ